jgi:hypothetical protein
MRPSVTQPRVTPWWAAPIAATLLLAAGPAAAETLTFKDPSGDDDGWGKAEYPTSGDYSPGAFDLTGLEIRDDGDFVVFEVEVAKPLTDPWKSKEWGGNGFSLQFVHVYLDLDGKKRSGERNGVPGSWVSFDPAGYWEKVVLISPQPASKVRGEVDAKAAWLKDKIVIPERTEARGRKIVSRVPKAALGGAPAKSWGVQAIMLSNEGFPAKEDVLARRTNEYAGEHRFGGGCDHFGDPQIMDMLAGKASGDAGEKKAQHDVLSAFTCHEDAAKAKLAKLPMIRR